MPPVLHVDVGTKIITRRSGADGNRVRPLNEPALPVRPRGSRDAAMLQAIINWLEVDQRDTAGNYLNLRWSPTGTAGQPGRETYCNIYAYDYAYLAGVDLPRLWWTGAGKAAFLAGSVPIHTDARGFAFTKLTTQAYGTWLHELNANALLTWFQTDGPAHGWSPAASADQAQLAANGGQVVVWCGARKVASQPGHITVIVPETSVMKATRDAAGKVLIPLQSQAGAKNFRYHTTDMFAGGGWQATGLFMAE
jgi:hypothetical protein